MPGSWAGWIGGAGTDASAGSGAPSSSSEQASRGSQTLLGGQQLQCCDLFASGSGGTQLGESAATEFGPLEHIFGQILALYMGWVMQNESALSASLPSGVYGLVGVEVDVGKGGPISARQERALVLEVAPNIGNETDIGLSTLSGSGFGVGSKMAEIEASAMTLEETPVMSSPAGSVPSARLPVLDLSLGAGGGGVWIDNHGNFGLYGYGSLGPVFLGGGLGWSAPRPQSLP